MNDTFDPITVLIIDDDEPLLNSLQDTLERSGYVTLRANRPETALKILDRTPEVDVIISDIRMPGMDGIELMRIVRQRYEERRWLQVIFLTGHATIDNSVDALRLQAVDFLHKPVRRNQLLDAVATAREKAVEDRRTFQRWQQSQARLSRLIEEASHLSQELRQSGFVNQPASDMPRNNDELDNNRMLDLLKTRDIRTRYFSDKLFADPAWLMLLDLMEQHLRQKTVSVSGICIDAGVPPATAARRLEEMEQSGFVVRKVDHNDKRRQLVALTPKSVELVTNYLRTLHDQMKKI
ncbi:response regulator [Brucella intermedia]|uniref:response regulator n=1 Tax=Brucella intermedia TaxID=94625 RepID=UPI00224AB066|nr:response regulator [Brucella intermedia]